MPTTYKALATVTLTSATSTISFTNVPQTYTDLIIKFSARNDYTSGSIGYFFGKLILNGTAFDTNFVRKGLYAINATVTPDNNTSSEVLFVNNNSSQSYTFGNLEIYIPNYTSANNKSILFEAVVPNNSTQDLVYMGTLLWSNTAAITSISLTASLNGATQTNWMQHTTATLYAVKNV